MRHGERKKGLIKEMPKSRSGQQVKIFLQMVERVCLVSASERSCAPSSPFGLVHTSPLRFALVVGTFCVLWLYCRDHENIADPLIIMPTDRAPSSLTSVNLHEQFVMVVGPPIGLWLYHRHFANLARSAPPDHLAH